MAASKLSFFSSSPILLPIFLLLLLSSAPPIAADGSCNADDKKALLAIKDSFQSPDILSNWTDAAACCGWDGIRCDAGDRVTAVRIFGSTALSGTIPNAISDLPFLTTLVLSNLPGLTGPIPDSFAAGIPHLLILNLQNNSLTGPVPSSLSRISSLLYLDLSDNKLSGSIPAELSLLKKLFLLSLSHNLLTGAIPASFGNFNTASPLQLDLSNNLLSGNLPPELGRPDWVHIDLSNNQLDGDASVLFSAGKGTTRINLARNRFELDLSGVSFPLGLLILHMEYNRINGSIPGQINQLTHLTVLNLSHNKLCGAIPVGPVMAMIGKEALEGNVCLCGAPLGPCTESG